MVSQKQTSVYEFGIHLTKGHFFLGQLELFFQNFNHFCLKGLTDAEKANKSSNKEERETETTELDRKVDEELLDSGNNIELINVT